MDKLPIKTKTFNKNFLQFIFIFLFVTFSFAYAENEVPGSEIGFLGSYAITSGFCVLWLGVKIGLEFQQDEIISQKINKILKKEKITRQEFYKKYRDIILIYDESIKLFDDIKKE